MNAFVTFGLLAVLCRLSAGDAYSLSGLELESTPNPPAACGETLTADTGTITSPNYPNEYPNWADCKWTITAPEGKRVALTFEDIDIDNYDRWAFCDVFGDFVAVFDGAEAISQNELDMFCASDDFLPGELPFTLASSSNSLTVQFLSNDYFPAKGFSASYSFFDDCGGALTDESGEFGTPDNYMNWLTCEWTITAQEGKGIQLNFDLYDVEKLDCLDYVEIYDAGTGETTKRCDNASPTTIQSQGDLTIRYVAQPKFERIWGSYDGASLFQASYSSVE